jgi:hypothetical protein
VLEVENWYDGEGCHSRRHVLRSCARDYATGKGALQSPPRIGMAIAGSAR